MNIEQVTVEQFQTLRGLAVVTGNPLAVEMSQYVYVAAQGVDCLKQERSAAQDEVRRLNRIIENALLLAKPAAKKGKKPSAEDARDALRFVREELEKALATEQPAVQP